MSDPTDEIFADWYLHKKTGKRYFATCEVTDCTNSRDGTISVLYSLDTDDEGGFFVREKQEFLEKFERIPDKQVLEMLQEEREESNES